MTNLETIISFGSTIISLGLAIFVLLRDRQAFLHRIFAVGMMAFALEGVLNGLSFMADLPETLLVLQKIRLVIAGFIPPWWLLFALSFGNINYQESIKRVAWLIALIFLVPLLFGIGLHNHLIQHVILDNSANWIIKLGWSGQVLQISIILGVVFILMYLERTLKTTKGHMRWQIKFVIIGLGGLFALRIYTGGQTLIFRAIEMKLELLNNAGLIVAGMLIARGLYRLRLLSLSFYPSQAVLYNSLTVMLVGVYFIVVGVIVNLLKYFKVEQEFALKIFVIFLSFLGLFVLLFSDRARHKIKYFISTHFKRPAYDYRQEWMRFTKETSMITDPDALCAKVARMISEGLEVLSVTIWLFDDKYGSLRPAGSTIFSESSLGHSLTEEVGARLMHFMKDQEKPLDLDDMEIPWAQDIKQDMPTPIPEGRIRYCARLSAGGHFLGLITLGERVGYEPFSFEEFDLLKTMADQIAASLLNLKLADQLRKAKEMEAFQTISAFMMHDLKNLASTLSLTMQNLPLHFDNPEFRKDALRIIEQSVTRINKMCSRLSMLSKKMELSVVEADLNELIDNSLSSMDGREKILITREFSDLPKIFVDPEQIQKVLINLIINAKEAMADGGRIQIKTQQRREWAVISVRDNGCGMSKEFISQSLFKPFKTTKQQGMGIGLYQSKMIVEAHGGKLEVESAEGEGTEFRIFLPIKKE